MTSLFIFKQQNKAEHYISNKSSQSEISLIPKEKFPLHGQESALCSILARHCYSWNTAEWFIEAWCSNNVMEDSSLMPPKPIMNIIPRGCDLHQASWEQENIIENRLLFTVTLVVLCVGWSNNLTKLSTLYETQQFPLLMISKAINCHWTQKGNVSYSDLYRTSHWAKWVRILKRFLHFRYKPTKIMCFVQCGVINFS